VGVFAEIIIGARNEYEKMIADAGLAGALGWSSGTAPHLVDRKPAGKAQEIIKWPLGFDASLTPTPAEPRNGAIALKTYQPTMLDIDATPQAAQENRDEAQTSTADADQSIKSHEVDIMSDEQFAELKTLISAQGEKINALETVIKTAPVVSEVKAASVVVTSDPADRPFTNVAEQMQAVKSFAMSNGQNKDARLSRIEAKALGGNEAIPSEGGFLLDPILVADILKPMHEPNTLPAMARQLPVGNNSNFGWINGVDETSRADGSRWGGVLGYRLAEAATKTASQPKFRRINWELKKYAVLIYGTDELLADAAQFSAIVNVAAGEELLFMVGADIMGGLGVAGPLGILASPALVSVAKEAGQSAATITSVNLSKMWARLPSRSKASAAWFVNTDTNVQLDQLSIPVAMGALEPRFVNYNASGAMTIKGRPVIETEFNPTLGTVGDVLLADMNEYLFWQKAGVDAATSIHVQFLTDQTVFRFVMRCDGTPSVSTPLTPYKGSATLSPFVALATRA
jgi:HK97 family phage major capsid protein